jgi:iron complex transport system permease protein
VGAWVLAFVLALKLGAVPDADVELITQLRLPRALLASGVGMGLAVAGATLQALFSNPLCDPYTLGISAGAAVGAALGASLGLASWVVDGLAGTAFAGALLFTGFLYLVSLRPGRGSNTILLTGVMLGFLGSSLVALWMALSDSNGIQGALFWLLGDLSRARARGAVFSLLASAGLSLTLWARWRELDALLVGEESALALGVEVGRVRRRLMLVTSLLIAVCVSAAGLIGFVGLIVPHLARRFVGSLHLRLLPLCAIWGAAALTGADAVARVAVRPYELPVGVVTALVGAPFFLWVMLQRRSTQ